MSLVVIWNRRCETPSINNVKAPKSLGSSDDDCPQCMHASIIEGFEGLKLLQSAKKNHVTRRHRNDAYKRKHGDLSRVGTDNKR